MAKESSVGTRIGSSRTWILLSLSLYLGLAWMGTACGSESDPSDSVPGQPPRRLEVDERRGLSSDAKLDTLALLREDLADTRHPSDGGGRAWVESVVDQTGAATTLHAGGLGRINVVYEAGELGIEPGGGVYLLISPYWDWDNPQDRKPSMRGYTQIESLAKGIVARSGWRGGGLLPIEIKGRKLEAGEQIRITYGAGPALARVDSMAEQGSQIWIAVDGDGDGVRSLIEEPATVDVLPAAPAQIFVALPTTARPGESVEIKISVLDEVGNAGIPFAGEISLEATGGLELPRTIHFLPKHQGRRTIETRATKTGVQRVSAGLKLSEQPLPFFTTSNPMIVEDEIPRLLWADLHGHSQLTDGTGTVEDFFVYARDVAGLDVVSLTDHDHWGARFLDASPKMWREIRENVIRFHDPGSFVTLLGYEWTSWLHGHRHVIYFDDDGDVLSTLDPEYETPAQLWAGLRGSSAMTFAHHSAGGPISTNWAYRPPPEIEPVTEITSVHGSSEAMDSPARIYNPVPGNFVRDMLDAGFRFGFIGSGDSHDGHPGLSQLASPGRGGLAAIFSEQLSREGVREALRSRRVYATNGARIYLDVTIDGKPMGSTLPGIASAAEGATQRLRIRVVSESELKRVIIIRSGQRSRIKISGGTEWTEEREIRPLRPGEYHYIRVHQSDGGVAWSSPIYAQ